MCRLRPQVKWYKGRKITTISPLQSTAGHRPRPRYATYSSVGCFMHPDMWLVILMFFFCVACDSLATFLDVEPKDSNESNLEYAIRLNDRLRLFYDRHNKLMECSKQVIKPSHC
ncbi:unnamed protein product [Chrysodeixis includens]|uniref:Uncharacterized protein n=1 Tax=Chrysodeixis includens TaxID=689277 RepID=A0A9N8KTM6_CHRIL|nr:unnamed protein product [Chrysodeixis includens]